MIIIEIRGILVLHLGIDVVVSILIGMIVAFLTDQKWRGINCKTLDWYPLLGHIIVGLVIFYLSSCLRTSCWLYNRIVLIALFDLLALAAISSFNSIVGNLCLLLLFCTYAHYLWKTILYILVCGALVEPFVHHECTVFLLGAILLIFWHCCLTSIFIGSLKASTCSLPSSMSFFGHYCL
jgi:hypothetical protein